MDDAVEALLLAAAMKEADGQIFNLGGNCVISLKDLADLLIQINGCGEYHICSFPSERERIDIGDYYANYNHIRSILNWEPRISLQEGLTLTLTYYREHLQHYL